MRHKLLLPHPLSSPLATGRSTISPDWTDLSNKSVAAFLILKYLHGVTMSKPGVFCATTRLLPEHLGMEYLPECQIGEACHCQCR